MRRVWLVAHAVVWFASASEEPSPDYVRSFALSYWDSDETFDLRESPNSVLVLDFFAYWCQPCLEASTEIEAKARPLLEGRSRAGNAPPVHVLSVNIEREHPERTRDFARRAGLSSFLDDPGGRLLAALGGKALPYVVVLKVADPAAPDGVEILYRNSGFEGSDRIIEAVEAIGGSASGDRGRATAVAQAVGRRENLPTRSAGFVSDVAFSAEDLRSSDVAVNTSSIRLTGRVEDWDWLATLGRRGISVDYKPFSAADLIGVENRLEEENVSLQLQARKSPSAWVRHDFSVGAYRGFSDHRSVWLDEYYRQQFGQLDGYEEARPWGFSVGYSASLDTRSRFGILGGTLGFQQDDVAPGYDRPIFQGLDRGRERLYTGSLTAQLEAVVTPFARARHQLQIVKTTDRGFRYRYALGLNVALSENWVLRSEGNATYESSETESVEDFRAYSGGITIERDWGQTWFLGATGRVYRDNGQIETSILVSSGPPPLRTSHLGLSLRRRAESLSWKLEIASYNSRFDEIETRIRPFGNLYRGRDWSLISASLEKPF